MFKLNFLDSKYELLNLDKFDLDNKYVVFSGIGNHQTFIDIKRIIFKLLKILSLAIIITMLKKI